MSTSAYVDNMVSAPTPSAKATLVQMLERERCCMLVENAASACDAFDPGAARILRRVAREIAFPGLVLPGEVAPWPSADDGQGRCV